MVLAVDDDASVREVTHELLKKASFEVLLAGNGFEALHRFKEHADEIQVVLLDIEMPGLSGRPLIEKLREIRPVPILLCSGNDEERGVSASLSQLPIAGFIQKPYGGSELVAKIEAIRDEASTLRPSSP